MSTTEEHHFEVIVTTRDGVVIDFDLNDENSATWWEGTVFLPKHECWTDESNDERVAENAMREIARQAKRRIPDPVGSYCVYWQGHILDAFDTEEEAEKESLRLAVEVNAGKLHEFLDPEDIEDYDDPFPVLWTKDVY